MPGTLRSSYILRTESTDSRALLRTEYGSHYACGGTFHKLWLEHTNQNPLLESALSRQDNGQVPSVSMTENPFGALFRHHHHVFDLSMPLMSSHPDPRVTCFALSNLYNIFFPIFHCPFPTWLHIDPPFRDAVLNRPGPDLLALRAVASDPKLFPKSAQSSSRNAAPAASPPAVNADPSCLLDCVTKAERLLYPGVISMETERCATASMLRKE